MERHLAPHQHMALRLYQAGMHLGLPAGLLLGLPWFLLKAKRRRTIFRRLGFQTIDIPPSKGRPLWVHALSLGETLSCVNLVRVIRERLTDRPLVFSTSTLAARQIAEQRLADQADAIFYFPFDLVPSIRRTLRSVRPAMVVVIETDIWPGLMHSLRRAGLPAWLVNARLSPQTFKACRRWRALFVPALNSFEQVFPQSDREADRYRSVGVEGNRLGPVGNLKFDTAAPTLDPEERRRLIAECGFEEQHRIWLAGSTHPGEENIVCQGFNDLRRKHSDLRLILVPRHPHRAREVRDLCSAAGLQSRLLTEPSSTPDIAVVIVDVLGRLATLYHLATAALVGGSLVLKGGQNPIEPAAAGKPVLFGGDMTDFPDIAREMVGREAAFQVEGGEQLRERMDRLLSEPELARRMGARGCALVAEHGGTTRRVADAILERLDGLA